MASGIAIVDEELSSHDSESLGLDVSNLGKAGAQFTAGSPTFHEKPDGWSAVGFSSEGEWSTLGRFARLLLLGISRRYC
jgi:hypothetical protein